MSETETPPSATPLPRQPHVALVTGDVVVDWNLAHTTSAADDGTAWDPGADTCAGAEPGGAALLGAVVAAAGETLRAGGGPLWQVHRPELPEGGVQPGDPRFHHSFAVWTAMKRNQDDRGWRVARFLGLQKRRHAPDVAQAGPGADVEPELLVLDDGALAFRDSPDEWPRLPAEDGAKPWIVMKMASPVTEGPLWSKALRDHADRMIVVVPVDDIRRSEVQVSTNVSWERTAQDLLWELTYNPRINTLARCAHVVISFSAAGALLLSRDPAGGAPPQARLLFDPSAREGSWEQAQHDGGIVGSTICLTAAIAYQVMRDPGAPDVARGVLAGLGAIRQLHRSGYPREANEPVRFPMDAVVRAISAPTRPEEFAEAKVRQPGAAAQGLWSILDDRLAGEPLEMLARKVVTDGPAEALTRVPLGRFGKLLTVDRREIESLSSIQNLLREYCRNPRPERPFSIAVFGAPGAGKSFGVSQVASAVVSSIKELKFNLSQLPGPEALLDALHQVRDVALTGAIPLVFWDEFDTTLGDAELGWLRYFLAPMQDGSFQQGQITHPIGRAIFVFAGGTATSYAKFNRTDELFKQAKGPDFVSRLKGYLDVLGPDPRKDVSGEPVPVLRRAILLRSMLRRSAPHLFDREPDPKEKQDLGGKLHIDPGVLRAFLLTREYRHGARSMESLIAMSSLSGKRRYERSLLPAEEQLELHVNARDFLSIIQQLEWEPGGRLDELAQLNHEIFRKRLEDLGYTHGPRTDDAARRHSSLLEWSRLPLDEQEQNRSVVRDIPNKLASVGLIMLPARAGEENEFSVDEIPLERLAEAEHDRWVRQKLEAGWSYAPTTDKEKKLHQDLLPWTELSQADRAARYGEGAGRVGTTALSEDAKEKDRQIVQAIPTILARVGYTVVRDGTQVKSGPASAQTGEKSA